MSFKVKDLAISVSFEEASTCGTWTRTTSGIECLDSVYFRQGNSVRRNLSVLKAQLRQAVARA